MQHSAHVQKSVRRFFPHCEAAGHHNQSLLEQTTCYFVGSDRMLFAFLACSCSLLPMHVLPYLQGIHQAGEGASVTHALKCSPPLALYHTSQTPSIECNHSNMITSSALMISQHKMKRFRIQAHLLPNSKNTKAHLFAMISPVSI